MSIGYKDVVCFRPWYYLEISGKEYNPCCPGMAWFPYGEYPTNPMDVLNGEAAQEFRRSVLDGSYRYCHDCSQLHDGKVHVGGDIMLRDNVKAPWQRDILDNQRLIIDPDNIPLVVSLIYDPTCGLCCPFCRPKKEFISPGTPEFNRLLAFQESLKKGILRRVNNLWLSGSGDPFTSPLFMRLMESMTPEEFPSLRFNFLTNGQQFTRERVSRLGIWRIGWVTVSVDAATPETYAKNRVGGNWDRLLDNLKFMRRVRELGFIEDGIAWQFIVQQNNWREMGDFVRLAKKHKVDTIAFTGLRQNVLSDEDYAEMAVWQPQHREYKKFSKYINQPFFRQHGVATEYDLWRVMNPE